MTKALIAFGAHSDDLEIGAGGAIARLAKDGWNVDLVVLTSDADPGQAALRRDEALLAAKHLGVAPSHIHWLDLPDTRLAQVPSAEAIGKIRGLVSSLGAEPDLVIANTSADSHTDHKAAHELVVGAFRKKPFLLYSVVNSLIHSHFAPRVFVDTSELRDAKLAALRAHASQERLGRIMYDAIDAHDLGHGASIGVERAEGFEVLVQEGAGPRVQELLASINDCPFHRFWHPLLAADPKLYVLYATPVLRRASHSSRRINYDHVGIDALNSAFAQLWHGTNPLESVPAQGDGMEALLDRDNVLISGGATSNRFTDRYFNHFAGLRYTIDHTMPGYCDLRVHDRIRNENLRSRYGRDQIGSETILCDLGLLSVMRNPAARGRVLVGCMGVHSPGSFGCFQVLTNRLLLREFMDLMPAPVSIHDDSARLGYQVLVEQDVPCDNRPARILRETLHEITVRRV